MALLFLACLASTPARSVHPLRDETRSACINITSPSANHSVNTPLIQTALDAASAAGAAAGDSTMGCVSISGGDYLVGELLVGSDTRLRLERGSRLVNVVNVTLNAVVHVFSVLWSTQVTKAPDASKASAREQKPLYIYIYTTGASHKCL